MKQPGMKSREDIAYLFSKNTSDGSEVQVSSAVLCSRAKDQLIVGPGLTARAMTATSLTGDFLTTAGAP